MKIKFKCLKLALLSVIISTRAFSQHNPDSLMHYIEVAEKNNPGIKQKFFEYKAAMKRIPQAGSLPDPQLDMGVFLTPMEISGGKQVADLRLMQMFPWFGVLKNAKEEMSLMARAEYELFRDAKLQLNYDVQRTWYELFRIRRAISITEKNLEILGLIEQSALVKFKTGSGGSSLPVSQQSAFNQKDNFNQDMGGMGNPGSESRTKTSLQVSGSMQPGSMAASPEGPGLADLYRIKIEAGDLKNSIAGLKDQELNIIALFNSYLGRHPLAMVYTGVSEFPDTAAVSLPVLADSILKNNPMLIMPGFEKEAYQAKKKMVTGMGYPMLGVGLNYSVVGHSDMSALSMNGNDMIMPMISVSLPVYRKKYRAMRDEADLLSEAADRNYQAASNSLTAEYYNAFTLYQDAKRRFLLYQDQYLLTSKTLEIMLKSYQASSVSLTDVLRIRQQALDFELKQTEAVADLNKAKALLGRLMGGGMEINGNR